MLLLLGWSGLSFSQDLFDFQAVGNTVIWAELRSYIQKFESTNFESPKKLDTVSRYQVKFLIESFFLEDYTVRRDRNKGLKVKRIRKISSLKQLKGVVLSFGGYYSNRVWFRKEKKIATIQELKKYRIFGLEQDYILIIDNNHIILSGKSYSYIGSQTNHGTDVLYFLEKVK